MGENTCVIVARRIFEKYEKSDNKVVESYAEELDKDEVSTVGYKVGQRQVHYFHFCHKFKYIQQKNSRSYKHPAE